MVNKDVLVISATKTPCKYHNVKALEISPLLTLETSSVLFSSSFTQILVVQQTEIKSEGLFNHQWEVIQNLRILQ
mgnify:FL=1